MADVVELCVWQQIGGQALVAKRQHSQCALEVPVAGVGCAIRKNSLPLEREMCSRGDSGGGEACRCLGGSGGEGEQSSWRCCRRVGHADVLEVLSGRAVIGKSSRWGGKSLLTLKFSAKRIIFTRKRMLYD